MQLFAYNVRKELIHASFARRQRNYYCLECGAKVHKRGGTTRRAHFYHISNPQNCKLGSKTLTHLQIQCHLESALPGATMERPFPTIGRIADVAWEQEKIIFEVQYSPIHKNEVHSRIQDYQSLGWQVVWLLHTHTFCKPKLSPAEIYLLSHPHYFTSMNAKGEGQIWDQMDILKGPYRLRKLYKKSVSFTLPKKLSGKEVRKGWKLHFQGDLTDLILQGKLSAPKPPKNITWPRIRRGVKRLYMLYLDHLYQRC